MLVTCGAALNCLLHFLYVLHSTFLRTSVVKSVAMGLRNHFKISGRRAYFSTRSMRAVSRVREDLTFIKSNTPRLGVNNITGQFAAPFAVDHTQCQIPHTRAGSNNGQIPH